MSLASDHKPVDLIRQTAGISRARESWTTPEDKWYYAFNIRFRDGDMTQTPGLTLTSFSVLGSGSTYEIIGLFAMPVTSSTSRLLCLTRTQAFAYFGSTKVAVPYPVGANTWSTTGLRIQGTVDGVGLYLVHPSNKLMKLPAGGDAFEYLQTTGPEIRAKHCEIFYNHLVVANNYEDNVEFPLRVRWSDINDFGDFEVLTTNEADYFDISVNQISRRLGLGITGIKRLGNVLAIYTQTNISNMRYVGYDNGVMTINEQVSDTGCQFPYSLVGYGRYHAFIGRDDFYAYDGQGITPFGAPIKKFFFADLSTNTTYQQNVWGWVNDKNQEICWFYPSTASTAGECDKVVVFNYLNQEWYTEFSWDKLTALSGGFTSVWDIDHLDLLSTTIDGLDLDSATIDGLDFPVVVDTATFSVRYSGIISTAISNRPLKESTTVGVPGFTDSRTQCILETGDLLFGDLQQVKEIDTLLIDAYPAQSTGKIQVWVAIRDYLSAPVVFEFMGQWTPTVDVEKRFTKIRKAGRVFRFRFVTDDVVYGLTWGGFAPNFKESNSEK